VRQHVSIDLAAIMNIVREVERSKEKTHFPPALTHYSKIHRRKCELDKTIEGQLNLNCFLVDSSCPHLKALYWD